MLGFFLNIIPSGVYDTSKAPKIGDDEDLIARIKKGDTEAFEMLVKRHKDRAYHTALGMLGNPEDAKDLTQEAWVRTYRSMHRFREGSPFYPWFHSILSNLCKNALRHRDVVDGIIAGSSGDEWMGELPGDVLRPETLVEDRERKAAVWRAIQKLSPQHREVILLHFEELSYAEAAGRLGIPEGTLMSRLYYARKKLAGRLKGVFDE